MVCSTCRRDRLRPRPASSCSRPAPGWRRSVNCSGDGTPFITGSSRMSPDLLSTDLAVAIGDDVADRHDLRRRVVGADVGVDQQLHLVALRDPAAQTRRCASAAPSASSGDAQRRARGGARRSRAPGDRWRHSPADGASGPARLCARRRPGSGAACRPCRGRPTRRRAGSSRTARTRCGRTARCPVPVTVNNVPRAAPASISSPSLCAWRSPNALIGAPVRSPCRTAEVSSFSA